MKYTGIALVMLAAMLWGLSGGIADILMERGWNPLVISFYRGAAGFIFVFLWFLINFRENWVKPPASIYGLCLGASASPAISLSISSAYRNRAWL